MWLKVAALLVIHRVTGEDCTFTVSVLDVPGVQCVSALPCSGTYYATGLSQGVGACPTGSSCALLPLTPIMGCAATGRTDLVYVRTDGTLVKDGKPVTLLGAPVSTTDDTVVPPSTTTNDTMDPNSTPTSKRKSLTDDSLTRGRHESTTDGSGGYTKSRRPSTTSGGSGGDAMATGLDGDAADDASYKTLSTSTSNVTSPKNSKLDSLSSKYDSGSRPVSLGNSSANQQAKFNPGTILSDGSASSKTPSSDGLGLGSIIAIVVGCLAVVAIVAGARLLKKGKEAELATPGAAGGLEAYNHVDGGGGGGMTPKEDVLLL